MEVGGPQIMSICVAIYLTIYTFFLIFIYSAEHFLNTWIDNQKRDFWGPYPWTLDWHQYYFPIISKEVVACSRSLRMPLSNYQPQAIPKSSANQAYYSSLEKGITVNAPPLEPLPNH